MNQEGKESVDEEYDAARAAKTERKINSSMLIALIALVISLVGTITGIYEARIMRQQQIIMQEQKSAAAWPYVERKNFVNYNEKDNVFEISHYLENKGIGPAILGDVDYRYADNSVETYNLNKAIQKVLPDIPVRVVQNHQIDNEVLSAGESVRVFRIIIAPEKSIFDVDFDINEITDAYQSWFCYCSVFGDCWKLGANRLPTQTENCQRRTE